MDQRTDGEPAAGQKEDLTTERTESTEGMQGVDRVVRLGVTSGHVGAGRLPASVDKRRQRWFGLSERSPLTMAGTMEQEVTKETKNTGAETLFSDLIRGASEPRSAAGACEVLTLRWLYYLLFKVFCA